MEQIGFSPGVESVAQAAPGGGALNFPAWKPLTVATYLAGFELSCCKEAMLATLVAEPLRYLGKPPWLRRTSQNEANLASLHVTAFPGHQVPRNV